MKRGMLFASILFMLCVNVYGEENNKIAYVVTQYTQLEHITQRFVKTASVNENEIVFFHGRTTGSGDQEYEILVRTKQGQEGWINARYILLRDNQPLSNSVTERRWIPSFYQHFIHGADREKLFDYEPFWRDEHDYHMRRFPEPLPWWWNAGSTRFVIRDNIVRILGIYNGDNIAFVTINQQQDGNNIILYVACERKTNNTPQNRFNMRFSEGNIYRLILKIDGDYMDIFVDDDAESIATLIGVDEHFGMSIIGFFRGSMVDLSRIVWPRRADGTMDFPPPGIDMSSFDATHATTVRLRVRDAPSASSLIATTLDLSAEVQVLETGPVETIGGTTAPWVRLLAENGFTGWAFSGFLEPIGTFEEPEIYEIPVIVTDIPLDSPASVSQNNTASTPWLLFAIIGTAVVVAGGAMLFVVRRKR